MGSGGSAVGLTPTPEAAAGGRGEGEKGVGSSSSINISVTTVRQAASLVPRPKLTPHPTHSRPPLPVLPLTGLQDMRGAVAWFVIGGGLPSASDVTKSNTVVMEESLTLKPETP